MKTRQFQSKIKRSQWTLLTLGRKPKKQLPITAETLLNRQRIDLYKKLKIQLSQSIETKKKIKNQRSLEFVVKVKTKMRKRQHQEDLPSQSISPRPEMGQFPPRKLYSRESQGQKSLKLKLCRHRQGQENLKSKSKQRWKQFRQGSPLPIPMNVLSVTVLNQPFFGQVKRLFTGEEYYQDTQVLAIYPSCRSQDFIRLNRSKSKNLDLLQKEYPQLLRFLL